MGKLDGENPSGGVLDTSESPIWIGARLATLLQQDFFDDVGFFHSSTF